MYFSINKTKMIIKISNKAANIDYDEKKITFLDSRFYRTPSGGYVPSVTTILDAYPKGYGFYEWLKKNGEDSDEIRDEAGRRGSVVHDMTERFDNQEEVSLFDENGSIQCKLGEWKMFERYVEFRHRFPSKMLVNEQEFVSQALGYAGTIDRLIEFNGKLTLMDIKTSNSIYNHYWLQTASYVDLVKEIMDIEVEQTSILWLNAKTKTEGKKGDVQGIGWQMLFHDKDQIIKDKELFDATKKLWEIENGSMKPKETTYSFSHVLTNKL
jgi:hypothetical protein